MFTLLALSLIADQTLSQNQNPNVTEMRENKEINRFLPRGRKMCEHIKNTAIIFINNTDPFPHLRPCSGTLTRRTCGLKIGFNKDVEIICISLFHLNKTHLIFESLITK